jgi:hypothetical protein
MLNAHRRYALVTENCIKTHLNVIDDSGYHHFYLPENNTRPLETLGDLVFIFVYAMTKWSNQYSCSSCTPGIHLTITRMNSASPAYLLLYDYSRIAHYPFGTRPGTIDQLFRVNHDLIEYQETSLGDAAPSLNSFT